MGEGLQFPNQVDEAIRRQFEANLAANEPRSLDSYLGDIDDPKYLATLEELVAIALEYSWKQMVRRQSCPFPLSLEPYLSQFPVLRQEEIRVRLEQHVEDVRREVAGSQVQTAIIQNEENTSTPVRADSSRPGKSSNQTDTTTRLGQYQLFEAIGRGGMGVVHRGLHTRLQKPVAIKILPAASWSDQAMVQRFEREMRAAGQLNHPNVVVTHDAGESEGLHYLVMELVDGSDLETVLASKATLTASNACRIIHDIAQALQHAHSRNMIHRDIKPSNIMLTYGGEVKLLDLGLALLTAGTSESGDVTQPQQCMGTLHYMAPEQAEDSHRVGTPADIYSLGATLYRLLSGESPHGPRNASPLRLLAGLQRGEFAPLATLVPNCSDELSQLVQRMLSRNPADRPETAAEVAEALAPFAFGADIAKLLTPTSDVDVLLPIRPTLEEPIPQAQLENPPQLGWGKRVASRFGGWLAILSTTLILIFLAFLSMTGPWSMSGTPLTESGSSIFVHFPPAIVPKIIIDGQPAEFLVVQPGLLKVNLPRANPNDLKLDVQGEQLSWDVAELGASEPSATSDVRAIQVWPLLPQNQVIDWIRTIGGDAIVWDEEDNWFYLSSFPDRQISDLARVTRVELDESSVNDDDLWRLASLRDLVELSLAKTEVSDLGLQYLVNLSELLYLNLVDTRVSGPGMAHLNRLPSLRQLILSRTNVDDKGLEHLLENRLTQLTLDGTRVSPLSTSRLSRMSSLQELNLMDQGFEKQHLDTLRASLPDCKIVPSIEDILLNDKPASSQPAR